MSISDGRQLSHLIGFFLAKYNKKAVYALGFKTYKDLYSAYGPVCGRQPTGLKNIRDEYDPLLDNERAGWYQRAPRKVVQYTFDKYDSWSFEELQDLILSSIEDCQA